MLLAAQTVNLRLDASWVDYLIVGIYFLFVLGIGWLARTRVSSSIDFLLSGRSLPAWVTGLAFISANLGAVEIMGMSATGAQYGLVPMHYYWIGAIPAMLFLGVVMMPFYYGSAVRSVPEFMLRRFGPGAHLVNALSFAVAQLLIAGVNLFLLAKIVNVLLGWDMIWALLIAAVVVLSYITLGGLSAAIYNEVLQFFVIVAALLPLTLIGLHNVGGWNGLRERVANDGMLGDVQLHTWPGEQLSGFDSPVWSVVGIVFGLGFVLSFGYWTTNFVEVQRAMASESITAARKTPIIGAFPKMFIPFIIIVPGMTAAVAIPQLSQYKEAVWALEQAGVHDAAGQVTSETGVQYNYALLMMMRDMLPNGLLGVAVAGLLASFMAGMAANISAFNTVISYDIWQTYIVKDKEDKYYLTVGRVATVLATFVAIGTAMIARNFSNVMDYLQTLFGFFNAPLFATFILGMFWKRMTSTAGWMGLVFGTGSAVGFWILSENGVVDLPGQGTAFVAASLAFVVDILVSVIVSYMTKPKPDAELVGYVHSVTPKDHNVDVDAADTPWILRPEGLATICLIIVIALNIIFA